MIYLIADVERKYCKIGYSIYPNQRVCEIQTGNPLELELLHVIDGNPEQEKIVHAQFKNYHVRGEWFNYHNDIYKYFIDKDLVLPVSKEVQAANIQQFEIDTIKKYMNDNQINCNLFIVDRKVEADIKTKHGFDWYRLKIIIKILLTKKFIVEVGRSVYRIQTK